MKLKDLPADIAEVAIQRAIGNTGRSREEVIKIGETGIGGMFVFMDSIEGGLWYDVTDGKYDKFYKFHRLTPSSSNKNYEIY